ncbi:nitroreductase family protein [Clostridium akagii]|uniref:nitroreductase family protein n=1 Tax=Clostridium akagii TaxID=91623 RepID=UPI00047AA90D|nr:nitroreductase family protein [Clostridium akagii]
MKLDFPIEQTIKKRYSVRTYQEKRPISEKDKEKLMAYANALSNPFGVHVSFHLLETKDASNSQKLGTYGVIKGTKVFLGATVPAGELSLEAVGYDFEKLILYATHLGIGTCWLAATFNRSAFTTAIGVKENELLPAISPIGYPAEKKSLTESLFRKTLKSNQRKIWNELFFKENFNTPLTETDAGVYALPLEMLRLAPSASNKQPWRVVQSNGAYHFYAEIDQGNSDDNTVVIQRVDVGISASHFHLTTLEKDLSGKFEKLADLKIADPKDLRYLFSWIPEKE